VPLTSPELLTPFLTGLAGAPYTGPGGKHALTDVSIHIGGVLVDYCDWVQVAMESEAIEVTSWAAAERGYREYMPGRQAITFEFRLRGIEPALNTVLSTERTVHVAVSPHLADVAAGNPRPFPNLCDRGVAGAADAVRGGAPDRRRRVS
jgi:hypothetical protein